MITESTRDTLLKVLLLLTVGIYHAEDISAQTISDGGFESGNFSGWTQSGNEAGFSVSAASAYIHSGKYGAAMGAVGSLGYLSQTFVGEEGGTYVLSFWLKELGGFPNEFVVSWNGTNLFDQTNIGITGWTNLQYAVHSVGNDTLQFGFRNDTGDFALDDVQVEAHGSFAQLAFTSGPTGTNAGAGLDPVVVQAEDVVGNPVATNGVPIHLILASGSGTINGTLTQYTDPTGKATFTALSFDLAGAKTLQASAPGTTVVPMISGSFSITAGNPSQLALVSTLPSPQIAGAAFSPAPVIEVLDKFGNLVTTSSAPVTAAVSSSGGGGLGGGTLINADNGFAKFADLFYTLANPDQAETAVVYFSSPGLTPATNGPVVFDFAYTYTMLDLTNRNSEVRVNPTSTDGLLSWTVDGVNQMFQQWFWLRQDPNIYQLSFDQLGTSFGPYLTPTNATINFLPPGLDLTLVYTLAGGEAGSIGSGLTEAISIKNLNSSSVSLHLYEYADFDLGGEADGDTISFPTAGTVIQQGKGVMATQTVQGQEPISWEGGWYAFALDEIENGTPGVLSDAITPDSPGDQNFAYQWDISLAAGQTFSMTLVNTIQSSGGGSGPALKIALSGANVLVSWPTNIASGFQLQSSGQIGAGGVWNPVSTQPIVAGAQYQVTLPHSGITQFYRLQQ